MTGPYDPEQVAAARAEVYRVLGSAVGAKASEAFCLAHQRRTASRGGVELEASPPAAGRDAPATATVVEFGAPSISDGFAALGTEDRARLGGPRGS